MLRSAFLLICTLLSQACFCQQDRHYFIEGQITNSDTIRQIVIAIQESAKLDTVLVDGQGRFTFFGRVPVPGNAWFYGLDQNMYAGTGMWLSNDTLQVELKAELTKNGLIFSVVRLDGTQDGRDYLAHLDQLLPYYKAKQYDKITEFIRAYVKEHTDSYYSSHLIGLYLRQLGAVEARKLFTSLTDDVRKSNLSLTLQERIKAEEAVAIGSKIPSFKLRDTKGTECSLSALAKPLTLIHVWASWCKPCRAHSPELVSLYGKIDKSKVQLIGVSVDTNKKAWLAAIQKDKYTWPQLLNGSGMNDGWVKELAVSGIPAVFLIDQENKVLAKSLEEATLILSSN